MFSSITCAFFSISQWTYNLIRFLYEKIVKPKRSNSVVSKQEKPKEKEPL